jgi:hypothetical protein
MAQEFVALKACLEVSFKHGSLKGKKSGDWLGANVVFPCYEPVNRHETSEFPHSLVGVSLLAITVYQSA